MEIFINNTKFDIEIEENDSLSVIIDYVDKITKENGKIISEITINGEEFEKNKNLDLKQISIIEIKVTSPRIIALESLREMDSYIEKLKIGIETIIDKLSFEQEKEALEIIVDLISGLEWIYNIFNKIEEITGIDYNGVEFLETFNSYKEIMNTLLESLENKDFIMLSDILNYELKENLNLISEILPNIYNFILEEEKIEQNKC